MEVELVNDGPVTLLIFSRFKLYVVTILRVLPRFMRFYTLSKFTVYNILKLYNKNLMRFSSNVYLQIIANENIYYHII